MLKGDSCWAMGSVVLMTFVLFAASSREQTNRMPHMWICSVHRDSVKTSVTLQSAHASQLQWPGLDRSIDDSCSVIRWRTPRRICTLTSSWTLRRLRVRRAPRRVRTSFQKRRHIEEAIFLCPCGTSTLLFQFFDMSTRLCKRVNLRSF